MTQSRKFDPDRRLHPPLGARARRARRQGHPRAVGGRRRSTCRPPASRSAPTTPTPIVDHAEARDRGRWPPTPRSATPRPSTLAGRPATRSPRRGTGTAPGPADAGGCRHRGPTVRGRGRGRDAAARTAPACCTERRLIDVGEARRRPAPPRTRRPRSRSPARRGPARGTAPGHGQLVADLAGGALAADPPLGPLAGQRRRTGSCVPCTRPRPSRRRRRGSARSRTPSRVDRSAARGRGRAGSRSAGSRSGSQGAGSTAVDDRDPGDGLVGPGVVCASGEHGDLPIEPATWPVRFGGMAGLGLRSARI